MPRTIETILANHDEATQRRRTGRPVWEQHVPIGTILRDDTLTFEQTRDRVHELLARSAWVKGADEFSDLRSFVDELADTTGPDEFDAVLDEIYDQADADRVWLAG